MPSAQLNALNTAYKPYDISFNLINVTWPINDAWAVDEKADDHAMKKGLRHIANGASDHTVYFNDGCNINANTMPAGSMDGYNKDKTAVHKTDHWLGLLHTFEGYSGDGPGDYIDDTPVESTATDGCSTIPAKKSCPNQQASCQSDPIHDYMNYSVDVCYEGFTDLQVQRMRSMWELYRQGN